MEGIFRRRRLPHWDIPDATYFVTTCLDGSIPAVGLRDLNDYRQSLEARPRPPTMAEADWEHHKSKLLFARLDRWLDGKPAVRHLDQQAVATAVQQAIYHFAGVRYHLIAYVIMPSHFHWVFHPLPEWCESLLEPCVPSARSPIAGRRPTPRRSPREVIMHSLKSYAAHECNQFLTRQGRFWQDESYDHWVRDEDELCRIIEYVG